MCGTVAFTVSAPLVGAAYCYCTRCQHRTGTAFSATGLTQPGTFELTKGADEVRTYTPDGDGWLKSYCPDCGGQVFTTEP